MNDELRRDARPGFFRAHVVRGRSDHRGRRLRLRERVEPVENGPRRDDFFAPIAGGQNQHGGRGGRLGGGGQCEDNEGGE